MTTLHDRPNSALLVIDVQNGVMEGAPRRDDVIKNINMLVDKARAEHVPVIWVQHSDDDATITEWPAVSVLPDGRVWVRALEVDHARVFAPVEDPTELVNLAEALRERVLPHRLPPMGRRQLCEARDCVGRARRSRSPLEQGHRRR